MILRYPESVLVSSNPLTKAQGGDGILITSSDATGNKVEGNFIGTNDEGTSAQGNGAGVFVFAPNHTVGGTQPDMRNVISGNDRWGVFILGSVSDGNRVEGNFIGTTADGSDDLGNTEDGVFTQGTNNTVGDCQRSGQPYRPQRGKRGVSLR